jgi:hypothetical protein
MSPKFEVPRRPDRNKDPQNSWDDALVRGVRRALEEEKKKDPNPEPYPWEKK